MTLGDQPMNPAAQPLVGPLSDLHVKLAPMTGVRQGSDLEGHVLLLGVQTGNTADAGLFASQCC